MRKEENRTITTDFVINNKPKSGKRSPFNIETISLMGDMTGLNNWQLKHELFSCLYEDRCLQLIDFANVSRIDRDGVDILHNLLDRGMELRLFNVSLLIKRTIGSNRNKCLSDKIFDVSSQEEAVLMFEEEIKKLLKEKDFSFADSIKKRPFPRVDMSLPVEFKCDILRERQVCCHAKTENISKNGLYLSEVHAPNGLIRENTHFKGKDLHSLCLDLQHLGITLESEGVCVREQRGNNDNLFLAARFKNMNEYCERVLTGIIHDNTPLPNYLSYLGN